MSITRFHCCCCVFGSSYMPSTVLCAFAAKCDIRARSVPSGAFNVKWPMCCAVLRCHMAMVLLPPLPAQSALCQWQQRWLNVSGIIFPVPFTNQNTCVMCINLGLFPHTLCKGCLHCRITQKSETKIWYEREANGRWTWKQQQQKLKKKIKQKRRETDKKKRSRMQKRIVYLDAYCMLNNWTYFSIENVNHKAHIHATTTKIAQSRETYEKQPCFVLPFHSHSKLAFTRYVYMKLYTIFVWSISAHVPSMDVSIVWCICTSMLWCVCVCMLLPLCEWMRKTSGHQRWHYTFAHRESVDSLRSVHCVQFNRLYAWLCWLYSAHIYRAYEIENNVNWAL